MTQAAILAASGSPGTTQGFKNKIINGGMLVAQRGTAAVTTSGGYPVDRFFAASNANDFTSQQSTTVPSGANFTNSVSIQPTATKTPNSGTYALVATTVEGLNMQGLGWGTANAVSLTVSFWVRSSKTGIYSVSTKNADANRAWCQEYTINAANTWEFKSYTITGCPDGSWPINNTRGMTFDFWLAGQNTQVSTIGSWINANANMSTNQVNFFDSTSNVFYLTGLQVEVGTTATNFDFRSYGTELQLCQRYYEQTLGSGSFANPMFSGNTTSGSNYYANGLFLVEKRAAPTVVATNVSNLGFPTTIASTASITTKSFYEGRSSNSTASGSYFASTFTASAEL